MKRLHIPFGPMVFVPFLGAAVEMRKRPKDAWEEALVAFGGPVLGSAGALAFAGVAHATSSPLMFALADFGFMINLFNLIPLGSMDGGRICGALSPYAGVVGLGIGGGLAYNGLIANPIFYLILLGGGYETFMRFYDPLGHAPPNYYNISQSQVSNSHQSSRTNQSLPIIIFVSQESRNYRGVFRPLRGSVCSDGLEQRLYAHTTTAPANTTAAKELRMRYLLLLGSKTTTTHTFYSQEFD